MSIELPKSEENLEILRKEVEAIAAYYEQQASINESISSRAKSAAEAVEMKPAEIKKLAKVKYLENATQLVEEAEGLRDAVETLFEDE